MVFLYFTCKYLCCVKDKTISIVWVCIFKWCETDSNISHKLCCNCAGKRNAAPNQKCQLSFQTGTSVIQTFSVCFLCLPRGCGEGRKPWVNSMTTLLLAAWFIIKILWFELTAAFTVASLSSLPTASFNYLQLSPGVQGVYQILNPPIVTTHCAQ